MSFRAYLTARIEQEQALSEKENAFSGKHRLTAQTLAEVLAEYEQEYHIPGGFDITPERIASLLADSE